MKKTAIMVVLAMAMVCSLVQATYAGGSISQHDLLIEKMKREITKFQFHFYPKGDKGEKLSPESFSLDVVDGSYSGLIKGIKSGNYSVTTWAKDDSYNTLFFSETEIKVVPGEVSIMKIALKLANGTSFDYIIQDVPGLYEQNQYCDIIIKNSESQFATRGNVNDNGELTFSIFTPYDSQYTEFTITDKEGTSRTGVVYIDPVSQILNGGSTIVARYMPPEDSGDVQLVIGFEGEQHNPLTIVNGDGYQDSFSPYTNGVRALQLVFTAGDEDISLDSLVVGLVESYATIVDFGLEVDGYTYDYSVSDNGIVFKDLGVVIPAYQNIYVDVNIDIERASSEGWIEASLIKAEYYNANGELVSLDTPQITNVLKVR